MVKLQTNLDKGELMNITKIKAVCKNCKTEIIFKVGKKIRLCPLCNAEFAKFDDDDFYELGRILKKLGENKEAEFYLLGDSENR